MNQRALTQRERVDVVNAVQALVGRLDRVVDSDALFAAYQLVGERIRAEFSTRYVPGPPASPQRVPTTYRALPPPPAWEQPPARAGPYQDAASFDPFA